MNKQIAIEVLGESLLHWDAFYQAHYTWILEHFMKEVHCVRKAKKLTQELFAKILLKNPELVQLKSSSCLLAILQEEMPQLKIALHRWRQELATSSYCPN